MRRFYRRDCDKFFFFLCIWVSDMWKCKMICTGLLRVCGLLLCGSSCLGRTSLGWSVQKWIWLWVWGCSWNLSRTGQKEVIYFFVTTNEEVEVWWGSLGSYGCANKLEKIPVHEWEIFVLQDVFKSYSNCLGAWGTWRWVVGMQFHGVQYRFFAFFICYVSEK